MKIASADVKFIGVRKIQLRFKGQDYIANQTLSTNFNITVHPEPVKKPPAVTYFDITGVS